MKKVLIPTKLDKVAADILAANANYQIVQDASVPLAELAARHADAYAMIVRSEEVTAAVIDRLPNLKVVVRAGAGYDNIDTQYARKRGIDVMNTPGANSNAVAEEVVALMLADARHVVRADGSTRQGKWEKNKLMGREIAGKTVGIVGLGNIGRLVARRLSGFEVRLLGYDPAVSSDRATDVSVHLTDLHTLFAESDYVTLHVPENDSTRGLVSADLLARMKESATIVNCARAGIVDEEALRQAKKDRKLRFLNDVYPSDREGPKSVADIADLMMPHLGASTVEANWNAAKRAAEELIDFDEKGVASFIVNRAIPEGLDEAYCELGYMLAKLCRCFIGGHTAPKIVETSFYGRLEPFADWLLVPIVAGLWDDFDRSMDFGAARAYLEERGIEYVNRKGDPSKGYENSMTVDLISDVDPDNLRRASIRGTVAENTLMVSRINEFDKLYFEPVGNTAFFLYEDRPGVLGKIGHWIATAGANIEDVRCPHDVGTNRSLAILKVNRLLTDEMIRQIQKDIQAISAFGVHL
jgi:D-3-phosphoglycerate dehydrogenase / 2-oxoglutarate reductase